VLTDIHSEHVGAVLQNAAETVLETMFFMMAEGAADPVHPPQTEMMRTALSFSGEWSGTFELDVPAACARSIAESFVGIDDCGEIPPERVGEVMCELANMICGSTLSHLASDKIFNLSAPHVCTSTEHIRCQGTHTVMAAKGLNLGEGVVSFAMAIEAAP
jgi:CheY-specific phosphatase CheX